MVLQVSVFFLNINKQKCNNLIYEEFYFFADVMNPAYFFQPLPLNHHPFITNGWNYVFSPQRIRCFTKKYDRLQKWNSISCWQTSLLNQIKQIYGCMNHEFSPYTKVLWWYYCKDIVLDDNIMVLWHTPQAWIISIFI